MDGTHNFKEARLRVVILDHNGNYFEYSLRMDFQVTTLQNVKHPSLDY